jgi:hypothetical protein
MDCKAATKKMAELWDAGSGVEGGSSALPEHLLYCENCSRKMEQHRMVRRGLRSLAQPVAPPDLTIRLRTVAARERAFRIPRHWRFLSGWERHKLHIKDVFGPLAVPLASGLCSAVVLFSMLVPNFTAYREGTPDIPKALSKAATVKNIAPLGFSGEAVVDLTVDGNGRAIDYSIVSEHGVDKAALRRGIENSLLFTVFTPATAFGQPMSGKVRLTFRNSVIDVRG